MNLRRDKIDKENKAFIEAHSLRFVGLKALFAPLLPDVQPFLRDVRK